jgi:SAM-dependent methyltransferase
LSHGEPLDRWLDRWANLLIERAGAAPVLELGCGSGRDSAQLAKLGLAVVGIDLSASGIERARESVPTGQFYCQDIRAPFPVQSEVGVVVASLCLHYFPWEETVKLVERIRVQLRTAGVALVRLNSTKDTHHGATGYPRISDNYYDVDGQFKRFFDRESIDRLFLERWFAHSVEEHVVERYEQPKALWEVVLERVI